MISFCTAKATHIFSAKKKKKKNQHICVSLDVNFNESLINDIVSFEKLGPGLHGAWESAHYKVVEPGVSNNQTGSNT